MTTANQDPDKRPLPIERIALRVLLYLTLVFSLASMFNRPPHQERPPEMSNDAIVFAVALAGLAISARR